jgi:hypothetical protein
MATHFSSEQIEGRPLQFALLLANASLLSHSATTKALGFRTAGRELSLERPFKVAHLISPPAERCLVIPYQSRDHAEGEFPLTFDVRDLAGSTSATEQALAR